MSSYNHIQERILLRLKELDLPMKRVSLEAGLGETAVRDILQRPNHIPKTSTLESLAPVLQTSLHYLLFGRHEQKANLTLADRIQQRLGELDLSPRAASLLAGLNTHFLQKYLSETHRSMSVESLEKIAKALLVSPEWLAFGCKDVLDRESFEAVKILHCIESREKRAAWLEIGRQLKPDDS